MRSADAENHFVGIWGLVCVLVLTGVAVLKLTADFVQDVGIATDQDIVVDDEAMGTTVDHLAQVGAMVDALPSYPDTESGPATQRPCSTDSGDLFQPAVSRSWALTAGVSADALVESIAVDLADAGWTVPAAVNGSHRQPVTFDARDGWSAVGSLFFTYEEDAVVIEVSISDEHPCRLR